MPYDILIRGGTLYRRQRQRRACRRPRDRGRPHRRASGQCCRRRRRSYRRRRVSRSRRALSTSRRIRTSRCRSTRRPRARCARASPPRSSAIAGSRSRRCCPARSQLLADYLSPSAPWLPFREMTFPDYLDTLPGDRGQCRHAGRPQHAAADGDGAWRTGRRRAAELDSDDRAPGGWARAPARSACPRACSPRPAAYAQPAEMIALRRSAEAPQRRLLHPPARRIEQGAGGASRRRSTSPSMRRPCRDRPFQVLRHGQLGQGGADPGR